MAKMVELEVKGNPLADLKLHNAEEGLLIN